MVENELKARADHKVITPQMSSNKRHTTVIQFPLSPFARQLHKLLCSSYLPLTVSGFFQFSTLYCRFPLQWVFFMTRIKIKTSPKTRVSKVVHRRSSWDRSGWTNSFHVPSCIRAHESNEIAFNVERFKSVARTRIIVMEKYLSTREASSQRH